MIRKIICFTVLIWGFMSFKLQATSSISTLPAQPEKTVSAAPKAVPGRQVRLFFNQLNHNQGNFTLSNFSSGGQIEFSLRKDELVYQAVLHLQFLASPALIPVQSQVKIYLNDALINVVALSAAQIGKLNSVDVPIDPHYINDFNRLRIEFIGHYNAICENPANSSIWIDIDKHSFLELGIQTLLLKNDLSHFPEPFFDVLDYRPLNLPVVFAGEPDLLQQRAAAILASWFGSKALWRGVSFSVLYNQLPKRNAIVLATNGQRPDFLKNHKTVNAPTVEMISHPQNPYVKLLLILGRDDQDLLTAVQGIAQGNILFRGQSVTIDHVEMLKPRKPYDAPHWVPTNRPVTFTELQEFNEQLSTKGFTPYPISLRFNLPPDLFLNQSRGIDLRLKYRYSLPPQASTSHLDLSLNNYFIKSYLLESKQGYNIHFLSHDKVGTTKKLYIPAMELGVNNQLVFEFAYGTQITGGMQNEQCTTYNVINNYGVIDGSSTIDFSNYYHYIAMPNLAAFINAGFPFSRLADLSQTTVLVNPQSQPEAISTLLNVIGNIGVETGYPALAMTLTDDWSQAKNKDTDLLIIGTLPKELRDNDNVNILINKTQDWIKKPLNQNAMPDLQISSPTGVAESKATISAAESIAAFLGIQSPYYKQRSIVVLLAENQQAFQLLNDALTDKKNRPKIFGSVTVIRNSGVNSLRVGSMYHLGDLPWWNSFWFSLQKHPVNLALISLLAAIIVTFLFWNGLLMISRRRLKGKQEDKM